MKEERRIVLKFAYDGTKFHGFQRQPDKVTVEGALVDALVRVGAIGSPRTCGYRSSSRTDRGVSALGNLVSFRTSFPTRSICTAVNSEMSDVWVYSAVYVPDDFNPRAARQRWYRYHLAKGDQDIDLMRKIAERFVGIHDYSSYARVDRRNPMREIDSIDVSDAGPFHIIDFRAESFLWNMVRRIVWVMDQGSVGRLDFDSIGPEAEHKPRRIGLSPPEYLMLMDIDCGIVFPSDLKAVMGILRVLDRRMKESAMELAFAKSFLRYLWSRS